MNDIRNFVDTVKERIDISEVIGRYVKLDGHNKGLCPFHTDTNPSLSVNTKGQYFKCFGCGRGGDVFRFLELQDGMSFMEALRMTAGEIGMDLPSFTDEERLAIAKQKEIDSILNHAAWYHHQQLSSDAKEYLINIRGFNEDTIKRHQVGYGDGTLGEYLIDGCNKLPGLCVEAGVLVKVRADYKDHFAGRIVFPNVKRGQVVHMSGRALGNIEPRHLHLKGEIRYLYNEDDLRHEIVVLNEGIPDCLSAIQAGFPSVAVLGTSSFKPEYIDRFSRCKTVYVAMDADNPGQQAALKIGSMLGSKARILTLPEGNDLNEYFQGHSPEEFKTLMAEAKDIIRHRVFQIPQDTDKIELPTVLEPVLRDLALLDKLQAETYLSRDIKQRFGLSTAEVTAYRKKVKEFQKNLDDGKAVDADDGKKLQMCAKFEGLVDLADDNGEVVFLIKQDGELKIQRLVEQDEKALIPPRKDCIRWMLPRAEEVLRHYNSPEMTSGEFGHQLYTELAEYHRSISELPSDDYYGVLACWDMLTYFQEHCEYFPILCFSALPARGKTRTGAGITFVSYRGIQEQSLREANVMRFATYLGATLFFDVRDLWKRLLATQSDDLLLSRFEKKNQITRVLYPDRGPFEDMTSFSTFGPTIVSSNEAIDDILESRCITLSLREARRTFNNDVLEKDALPLREKLVAFRAKHLDTGLPDMDKIPGLSRLGDILKPLHQILMLVHPEGSDHFVQFARQLDAERKMSQRNSSEAQLFNILILLEQRVDHGMLAVKDITDGYNVDRQERYHFTPHKISRMLRSMGFSSCTMPNGNSGIVWEQQIIEDIRQRFAA